MPRVSICVPVYNGSQHIGETLASIWAQTYDDFEVIVVDDGSTDSTQDILAAQTDERLRVWCHAVNQGEPSTVDDTMRYARGELIKFVDHDDVLRADCVELMVAALDAHPSAGFVFSRRDILLEHPDRPEVEAWFNENRDLHRHFGHLLECNDGGAMLTAWVNEGMASNWIAEPAGVMTRRTCIERIGGRSRRIRLISDMDHWARMMACGDIAFIDEPLYTYRFAFTGLTGAAAGSDRHWLDPLWIAQAVLPLTEGTPELRVVKRMRFLLARRALRRALTHLLTRQPGAWSKIGDLLGYSYFRIGSKFKLGDPLYEPVEFEAGPTPGTATTIR